MSHLGLRWLIGDVGGKLILVNMIGLFWNPRGLNRPDKLFRAGDLIREQRPDFFSFSETKKNDFSFAQLQTLDNHDMYVWNWLPAVGTAGGLLVGINSDVFEVLSWSIHEFCVSSLLKTKRDNFTWKLISVYGSAYDEHKLEFINELHNVLSCWSGPTLVGGDFNLIRESCDKNTGNINQHWADLFNDWINKFGLMEIKCVGRSFTWSNNQENAVMATLDRIFVSTCWDSFYSASQVKALPRLGSDHAPLIIDTGALSLPTSRQFRFEKWWLQVDGFKAVVEKAWNIHCPLTKSIDVWQFKIRHTRKNVKGWCANVESAQKKYKQ